MIHDVFEKYKQSNPMIDENLLQIRNSEGDFCVIKDFQSISDEEVLQECILMYYYCEPGHRDNVDLDFDHFINFANKISGRHINSSSVLEPGQ